MSVFTAQETLEMVVEAEIKLMEPWNESLSDSTSDVFNGMKKIVEEELDIAFCYEASSEEGSGTNDEGSPETIDHHHSNSTCHTEVTEFSEGSILVMFQVIRIELVGLLPKVAEIMSDMKAAVSDGFLGQFPIDQASMKISKYILIFFSIMRVDDGDVGREIMMSISRPKYMFL